jgi:RHS repeat-associated protein
MVGEVLQDVRFGFLSSSLTTDFPNWFGGAFITTRMANQNERIERIRIFPGSITLKQGQQAVFAAVAYDEQNEPLSGVDFNWKTRDVGRGRDLRLMRNSVFDARMPGAFTVTAKARGREAQITVNVTANQSTSAQAQANKSESAQNSWRDVNPSDKTIGERNEINGEKKEAEKVASPESPAIAEAGWNEQNQQSASNPGNLVGRPPGKNFDYGAGSSNFTFGAPVVSLPGRGVDLSLGLTYNSRLWNKSDYELTYDIDRGFPAPGWSLGFGKILDMGVGGRSMMVEPDGTRHSFDGTSNYNGTGFSGYTTDGTFINYNSTRVSDGIYSASATLPNGTYINYTARGDGAVYPTYIRDRHGNYLTITYRNNRGPEIETVTDTMGRIITFNYDSLNRLISITAPRMNGTGGKGTRMLVRLHYKTQPISHGFAAGMTPVIRDNATSVNVIDAIYYPATNTGYWFNDADSYSTYGMITKTVEQRGMNWSASAEEQGTVSAGQMTRQSAYNYPLSPTNETGRAPGVNLTDAPAYTILTNTWDDGAGNTQSAQTTYQVDQTSSPRLTEITQPHPTIQNASLVTRQYSYNNSTQYDGMIDKIETFTRGVSGALALAGRTTMTWQETDAQNNYKSPRPTTVEVTDERNQTTKTEYGYGARHNQVTSLKEFGYDGTTLLRETRTQYINHWGYDAMHIFNLVDYTEVYDGSGNRLSHVDYDYDEQTPADTPGVIQHAQSHNPYNTDTYECNYREVCDEYDPGTGRCIVSHWEWDMCPVYQAETAYRGNVTKIKTYSNAQNLTGLIEETLRYDMTGNMISAATACCEQTSLNYSLNTQYAYPESKTRGAADPNSPHRITTSAVYNYVTGLVLQTTDANGRTSSTEYDPYTLRPTVAYAPTFAYVTYQYDDAAMTVTEEVREADSSSGGPIAAKTTRRLNGLGLIRREESLGANNVWDMVDVQYTKLGQVWKQSRPFRAGETPQWSEISYDALGRTTQVVAPDGSATQTFYNEQYRPGAASTLAGQTVRSRDAWGRERWVRYDALGRLAETVEPNPNGDGSIFTAGSLATKYTYDALDNLTKTEQGEQIREFAYDSLSRLTKQKLAEQSATLNDGGQYVGAGAGRWSAAFWYDTRSNLTISRDARGVTTWYSYQINGADDPLNRLQWIYYDLSGPRDTSQPIYDASAVTYEYMPTGDKTRIKKQVTQTSTEDFLYDAEGRLYEQKQTLANRTSYPLTTNYLYDTLSRLTDIQYPAQYGLAGNPRKVVQYSYDLASRLSQLKYNGEQQAGDIVYNAASQATQLKIGVAGANQVTENYGYDTQTGLLTNQTIQRGANTLLNLSYDYRKNLDGTNNTKTGQLRKITNNLDNNRNREYTYDALGRLTTAKGGNNLWQQVYNYDRYGNKLSTTASGVAANGSPIPRDGHANLSYTNQTNRINSAGFEYDLAGNQTRALAPDGQSWLRFEYDAANRLVYVKNDGGTVLQSFTYGATNARLISRDGQNNLTYYAWAGAEVIAEYTELASQPNVVKWTKSYVSAGGRLVSTASLNGQSEIIEYHHADRLGTRIVTDPMTGGYFEQETLPFGMALNAESSGATNRRFTSYDRSNITGLDYAVNRHYDSQQGRFTQVDPIQMNAASLGNPQSLNLFAYVENQPTNFVDPSGLLMAIPHTVCKAVYAEYNGERYYLGQNCWTEYSYVGIGGGPTSSGGSSGGGIEFGGGGSIGSGDNVGDRNPLPQCVKSAILLYYKSVGNSSDGRLNQVKKALDKATYSTNGFPYLSPPGIAESVTGKAVANAYTEGSHIYFRSNSNYDPTTPTGMALIVHEFTHVMQYREVMGFQAKYINQWLKHGAGPENPYENRGYINQDNSREFFRNNLDLMCLPGEN